jgi:hypothetical protein
MSDTTFSPGGIPIENGIMSKQMGYSDKKCFITKNCKSLE